MNTAVIHHNRNNLTFIEKTIFESSFRTAVNFNMPIIWNREKIIVCIMYQRIVQSDSKNYIEVNVYNDQDKKLDSMRMYGWERFQV